MSDGSGDLEKGPLREEETLTDRSAQDRRRKCDIVDTLKTISCIFVVMIPMFLFVCTISLVGRSTTSESMGLTPDKGRPKIIGGDSAEKGKYPHQIALLYRDRLICGATLLLPNVVITSAHCFDHSDDPSEFKIVAGEHNLNIDEGTEQTKQVGKIEKYPKYDNFLHVYDVALLFLTEDVSLNPFTRAIEISEEFVPPAGVSATVIGWGVKSEKSDGNPFEILQEAKVPILSTSDCQSVYGDDIASDGSEICAGSVDGRKDACKADSGGPLLIDGGEGKHTLIGIVSRGFGCGRAGYPGIYANVPFFSDWITKTITQFNEDNQGI